MVGSGMSHFHDSTVWRWAGGLSVTVSHSTGVTTMAFEAYASLTDTEIAQAQLRLVEARRLVNGCLAYVAATEEF